MSWLRPRVQNVDAMPLRFYDRRDLARTDAGWALPSAALKDTEAMRELF